MQTTFIKHDALSGRRILLGFTISLLLLLMAACATTGDKMDKLNITLRGYEKALRWAKYDVAYSFHKWDADEQPSIPDHLKNIRLTEYRVSNRDFDEKTMTAKQIVSMRYYDQNDVREHTYEDRQRWKYFPDLERWYLMSKPPTFK